MLDVNTLADLINVAISATDRNGNPISTTSEMLSYAQAIINTFTGGSVSNAPGTVTGTGIPSGGPLTGGAASGGLLNLSSSTWLGVLTSGFPTAPPSKLSSEATASTNYLESNGEVSFASGNITGTCTATSDSPGSLASGAGTMGQLGNLVGDNWATSVSASQGIAITALCKSIYGAVSTYLQAQTVAAYSSGQVTGNFPSSGGALVSGAGSSGSLS